MNKKQNTSIFKLIIYITMLPCIIVFALQIIFAISDWKSSSGIIIIMSSIFLILLLALGWYLRKKIDSKNEKEYTSFREPDIEASIANNSNCNNISFINKDNLSNSDDFSNFDDVEKIATFEFDVTDEKNCVHDLDDTYDSIKNINKLQEILESNDSADMETIKRILTCDRVERLILNEDISKINNIYELEQLAKGYEYSDLNNSNTCNTNMNKEEKTDMNNAPKKKKSSITGLIIFLIIIFGRVDRISKSTFTNMNIERLIGVIIPITIFIFVIFIIGKTIKSNKSNTEKNVSASQKYMNKNPKAKKSFYTKKDNNHVSSNYVRNSVSRNTYSNRGNMPTQPFPCENCGNMLKPGTLFCSKCDTKVDYSKFQ